MSHCHINGVNLKSVGVLIMMVMRTSFVSLSSPEFPEITGFLQFGSQNIEWGLCVLYKGGTGPTVGSDKEDKKLI